MRAIHVHRLHFGLLAFWALAMQTVRVRKGYFYRSIRFHINCSLGRQIFRHRGSYAEITRYRYTSLYSSPRDNKAIVSRKIARNKRDFQ